MWFHSVYKFQKKAQVVNDIALLRIFLSINRKHHCSNDTDLWVRRRSVLVFFVQILPAPYKRVRDNLHSGPTFKTCSDDC